MSAEIEAIQKVMMLIHKNIVTNPATTCHIDWTQVGDRYKWLKANDSEGFGPIALFTRACEEIYSDIDMHAIRRLPEFTVIVNEFTASSAARTSTEAGASLVASNSTSPLPMTVVQNLNKMEEKTMENATVNATEKPRTWEDVAEVGDWVKLEKDKDTYLRFRAEPPELKMKLWTNKDGTPSLDPATKQQQQSEEVTFHVDLITMSGKLIRPNVKFSTTSAVQVIGAIKKLKAENGNKLEGLMIRVTKTGQDKLTKYFVVKHAIESG
jgi:hypothetical protein